MTLTQMYSYKASKLHLLIDIEYIDLNSSTGKMILLIIIELTELKALFHIHLVIKRVSGTENQHSRNHGLR